MLGPPSEKEALEMVLAFYCIMEPNKRAELAQLAESLARQSKVVDGHTHYSLLDRSEWVQRRCDIITLNAPAAPKDA